MMTLTSGGFDMLSDVLKRLLYRTGALGLYHRLRNRHALTVIMFHRVLDPADPRWASADPDYTLDAGLFADCLAFFRRHYSVVGIDQVLAAQRDGTALPARPLLITFDDGWADNHDHALPRLRAAGLPALLFTVADAVGRSQPFFQEQLVGALRQGRIAVADLLAALRTAGIVLDTAPAEGLDGLRRVIATLEQLDAATLARVLGPLRERLDDGLRHMLSQDELRALATGEVAIGVHGKTHAPLTRATALDAELAGAREQVGAALAAPAPTTMSYPHGRYDAAIAERTFASGYALAFTSVPGLNPVLPKPGRLLARLGFEQAGIADRAGRFRPDWLALLLFRGAHVRLDG
jgi:peptidoglycan/xylan/chitin deacetylase (PgdA/CDA1 family)